ncbi:hypothetical protein VW29_12005 [Devosia limi DSM 17137]|nr:hypothetical protein VW29_12005 [Devosia limi DSM 17137]
MLVSGLVFMGTAPFVADYIVLAAGLVGLVLALVTRDELIRSWPSRLLLLALVLVSITIPFVYHSVADLLPLAAFAPLLLVPGIAALLRRSPEWLSPYAFAMACLAGAIAACLVGLAEYAAIEGARAGAGNNPIHYGGITTMLGFMALTGIVAGRSPIRLIFLLGPLAGLVAALLSGSRGPLLAWFALGIVAVPFIIWWNRRDRLVLAALAIALAAAIAVVMLSSDNRAVALLGPIAGNGSSISLASGGLPPETNGVQGLIAQAPLVQAIQQQDVARLAMLHAAWEAFKSSPIVGIGFGQIMPFAKAVNPDVDLGTLENLHSDIGNFAAMAGLLGVIAYGLVMLTPLSLLVPAAARSNRPLVLGSLMLVVGYGVLGLTNAMFGVLPQTMLFVLLLGYLMALQRNQATLS